MQYTKQWIKKGGCDIRLRVKLKKIRRWLRSRAHRRQLYVGGVAFLVTVFYAGVMMQQQSLINPSRLRPLLEVIAQAESKGNYNAYFGNATNQEVRFTAMTIQEVQAWQEKAIAEGAVSSAVGRYQIINTTLDGLASELRLSKQERFDERAQDAMAVALVKRRGVESYLRGSITEEEFAANLAKEWASLPAVQGQNPTESYYASDGLNKASVSPAEILHTIRSLRK